MKAPIKYQVLLLALTTFVAGANEYVLSGTLDLVSRGLGTPVAMTGQLITIYALVYGLCVPIVIALTSHLSRRTVLIASMSLYAVVSGLCFFVDSFGPFVLMRVLQALSGGVAVVSALSTAATLAGPGRQGRAIATVIMGFTLSLVVAVPIGREISLRFGWNSVFLVIGLLGLITALGQRWMLPELSPAATTPLRQQLAMLKHPAVAGGLLVTVLWMAGYVITYSYLTPYLIQVQHVPGAWVSPLLLLFGLASLAGTRIGGSYTDRHGHHATLVTAKILQALFLGALALLALILPQGSIVIIAIVLILWSLTAWACGPSQQVRVASLDAETSGVLVALNQSSMQIGIAAGSAFGGLATGLVGLASLPWLSAAAVIIALVLMIGLRGAPVTVRVSAR